MSHLPVTTGSDAHLRAVNLFLDPHTIAGVSEGPPEADAAVEIDGEYHIEEQGDPVRCCLCKQRTQHWNGFLISASSGTRHFIGSTCGPKHLGISFRAVTSRHKDRVARQRHILKIDEIVRRSDMLLAHCDQVLFSCPLLQSLENCLEQFKRAAGDAFFRLRALARRDGVLTEIVQMRDFEAEERRDANRSRADKQDPIYRQVEHAVGPLIGQDFLVADDLRNRVRVFRDSLQKLRQLASSDTERVSTASLGARLKEIADLHGEAAGAVHSINAAGAFFSSEGGRRLARWAAHHSAERLSPVAGGLEIQGRGKPAVVISAPSGASVQPMPPLLDED